MSPLDRKLLRDLWRMKGQAIAIGLVISMGVMMQVMMTGLVSSLCETRAAYYERYRLADIFAPVTRAPEHLADRLAELPGVSTVQSRITGRALIDLQSQTLPVQAVALSLPTRGRPALNDIYLTGGRLPASGRSDEIVLLQGFAAAHGLRPGDNLAATMNGTKRTFRIVGLAQSPEFLYVTAPGELIPDDARFGVIWMSRKGLAAAYDLDSAFNEVLLGLARGANVDAVLDRVDRMLAPYGARGAFPLADQFSNRFITEEISGLEASARVVPPLFLSVAAFLLYIVISRIVQAEREEIGLTKAFGYTNAEVGGHYFKLILAIAIGGAVAGCILGIAFGRAMTGVYIAYFKFPFLVFRLDPASFVIGIAASVLAASTGGVLVLRRVFSLAPADAMRAPAPPDFSRSGQIGRSLIRWLDQPSRMVLRRITRQPLRMAGAMVGIACGMALSAAMITIYAGFDRAIDLSFSVVDRSDATVSFTHAASDQSLFELARIPGVHRVEAVRHVPVIMRNGTSSYRGAVTGMPEEPVLNRALTRDQSPIDMPKSGIVLSSVLAEILKIEAGEMLSVDIREGRQPLREVPVSGIADTLLGAPAFMDLTALNRLLDEPRRVSGAYLSIDTARAEEIYTKIKDMPVVAGLSVKSEALDAFVTLMNSGPASIRHVMGLIAFVITFGIVYNAARIAYAERARDLASLRVIGFTKGETAFILLGELAIVTLVALPLGTALGHYLSFVIARGFSTDLYQIPVSFEPASYGQAVLVVLVAALISAWLVKRDLDRCDLVETLKTQE